MKNAIMIKEKDGKIVMKEIDHPYYIMTENSNERIKHPTFEFDEAYEEILLKLSDSMRLFEDMSTNWDHPFTFEAMIEKAKKRVSWIPRNFDAY